MSHHTAMPEEKHPDQNPIPTGITQTQLIANLNDSTDRLISLFGWNNLAMHHDDMRGVIKNHLRIINDTYNRMLKDKQQSLMEEILDKIQHSSLNVGGDVRINQYENGGCYSVTGVTVSDSFGNTFKFESKAATNEYCRQTGMTQRWYFLPAKLQYIPSYMWPLDEAHNG